MTLTKPAPCKSATPTEDTLAYFSFLPEGPITLPALTPLEQLYGYYNMN
ncbi:hypothetical protein [Phaeovulum sp.]